MKLLTIYKASAGSGKTFQLALYYVTLILSYEPEAGGKRRLFYPKPNPGRHREILAITFTNKATEEMKDRIIKVLKEVSDVSVKSTYRDKLMERIDTDVQTLARAARAELTELLFDFGNINISTIDSFFQSILRSFAYEADLSGNYDLIIDNKQLNEMAIADTLASAANFKTGTNVDRRHNRDLRQWLYEFLAYRMHEGKDITLFDADSKLRADLGKFIGNLSDENYHRHYAELNSFFEKPDSVMNLRSELERKLDEVSAQAAAIADALLQPDNISAINANKLGIFLRKVSDKDWAAYTKPNWEMMGSGEIPKGCFKSGASDEQVGVITPMIEELLRHCSMQLTIALMLKHIYSLGIFSEVLRTAQEIKVRQNTILLSDTNTLLNRIIGDCHTPFIYERTGQRLHNFLIDEFQDTSRLQWENLSPLLSESLASGNSNLIIGDVKQCIYRFRNAEPGLLDHEIQQELSEFIETPPLTVNYRSAARVVEFNSELFRHIAEQKGLAGPYATVFQEAKNSEKAGYVNLAAVAGEEESLDYMVKEIGRQLDPEKGGYTAGDVVVLVRSRNDARKVVERLLAESRSDGALPGVQVLSDEALYVNSSRAVRFIIDRLRELNRIKRSPAENEPESSNERKRVPTTEREIEWMSNTLQALNAQGIENEDAIREMIKRFNDLNREAPIDPEADKRWRESARGRSLYEIVENLIRNLPDHRWAAEEALHISAFQDLIVEFCRLSAPTVSNFLRAWDINLERNAAIGLAAGVNAIRVMTIHKSKGLEFACVHVPLLDSDLDAERGVKWYDTRDFFKSLDLKCDTPDFYPVEANRNLVGTYFAKEYIHNVGEQILDSVNVLYVAFTRAVNELSVSMKIKPGSGNNVTQVLRPILADMSGTELPDDQPWTCEFGTPTVKTAQSKTAESIETLNVEAYTTTNRTSEMWDFTAPAPDQEFPA